MYTECKYKVEVFETPDHREVLIDGTPIEEVDVSQIEEISFKLIEKMDIGQLIKFIGKFSKKVDSSTTDERNVNGIYRVTTVEL